MWIPGFDNMVILLMIFIAIAFRFAKSHPQETTDGLKLLSKYFKK